MNNYIIISFKTLMFIRGLLNKNFKTLLILACLCFKIALTELKRGKMDGIKRTTRNVSTNHSSVVDHSRVQKSTTLNRKFVKRPVVKKNVIQKDAKVQPKLSRGVANIATTKARASQQMIERHQRVQLQPSSKKTVSAKSQQAAANIQSQQVKRRSVQAQAAEKIVAQRSTVRAQVRASEPSVVSAARQRIASRQQPKVHMSAQEMKERAISDALQKVASMEKTEHRQQQEQKKGFFRRRGFAIAASLAVVSVCLLGYLVYLNLPDLSVRVAAMQSGIENAYPSYVPTSYRLRGLVKEENGTITMNFVKDDQNKFTLVEKKSSWDSDAVLANFVRDRWGSDYTVAKGQGLTVYISGSNAVWVNGGVLYEIQDDNGSLSTDDLHDIAIGL